MSDDSYLAALKLLIELDAELWEIVLLSFKVSLTASFFALCLGLPLGGLLAMSRFRGHAVVQVTINTLMSMPPVVMGLLVLLMLSRSGPLGVLGLLYTPTAMIIAQTLLIMPIVASLSQRVLFNLWARYQMLFYSVARGKWRSFVTLLKEGRADLLVVGLAAFGRAISEIGAVMIVGGNIEHLTRVMTTAIALETSKGHLEFAIALGLVLLTAALVINIVSTMLGRLGSAESL